MRIAMDVEGVLADIHGTWIHVFRYPFTKGDCSDWKFNNVKDHNGEIIGLQRFLDESLKIWKLGVVSPEEQDLHILLKDFEFDIVTARQGAEADIKTWLNAHKIKYGKFLVSKSSRDKTLYRYDVYIDDNPYMYKTLQEGQIQIMRTQPWNILVAHPQVERAMDMEHALVILKGIMNERNIYR